MPMRLSLDNRAVRALPIDAELRNATRQVANACFSQVTPTPVENPTLVAMSASALATIGLRGDEPDLVNIMSGCQLLEGSTPVAHCYAGHQFGSFAGQLGDGAAILLGEVVGPTGHIELQLKGAGPTPYSRSADGRKVLRSSLREFLCSEAMHGLGIPTTRAATLITSDTRVERDPLYSGASLMERCTVVSRLCPTFIRFGSFEVVLLEGHASDRHGPSPGNSALSQQLFDFVATTYFGAAPNDVAAHRRDEVKRVLAEITKRTAELVAHWQSVGWVHGVLNTDNMSIIGVTIDYGPFAFQEHFDPLLVSNTSDTSGKYAYAHQPDICEWNLLRLGEAFAYVVEAEEERNAFAEELKKQVRDQFKTHFSNALDQLYRSKLGLPVERTSDVPKWRDAFLDVLADTRADFTKSFHILEFFVQGKLPTAADAAAVAVTLSATKEQSVNALKRLAWKSRPNVSPQQAEKLLQEAEESPDRIEMMFGVPADQFKEHMRQQLRQAAKLTELRATIAKMEALQEDALNAQREERWKAFFDAYHQDILAAISAEERESRVAIMRQSNPRFVLRPWVAQLAIEAAEKGDFSVTQRLVDRLLTPYAESPLDDELFQVPPPNYTELCVSCSS